MNQKQRLRAAVVLVHSLPKRQAAKVFMQLDAAELRVLFQQINLIDQVSSQELQHAYEALLTETKTISNNPPTRRTANGQAHGENQNGLFDFLIDVTPSIQAQLLENEHPRNIALVLSLLPIETGSQIIHEMPPETRVNILRRMCQSDELDRTRGTSLADILQKRLGKILNKDQSRQRRVDVASRLLSRVDPKTCDTILTNLVQADPDLASELKDSVFNFPELLHLPDRELKIILKNVDTSYWAPALKNEGLDLTRKILSNLAHKPAELLNFEMANMEPVSNKDTMNAQHQIVTICLQLSDQGHIQLRKTKNSMATRITKVANNKRVELVTPRN